MARRKVVDDDESEVDDSFLDELDDEDDEDDESEAEPTAPPPKRRAKAAASPPPEAPRRRAKTTERPVKNSRKTPEDAPKTRKKAEPEAPKAAVKLAKKATADGAPKRKSAPKAKKGGTGPFWPRARRFLALEALTVGLGATCGVAIASTVLWWRASDDVETWLAAPPKANPGVIWSAPLEVRAGQTANTAALVGDLLSAGYQRVEVVDGIDQFSVTGSTFKIRSKAKGPGGVKLTENAVVTIDGNRVSSTEPALVRLAPSALATIGDPETRRTPVKLADLSPWVEKAVLSMEDTRFRDHSGVDPIGLSRALVNNLFGISHAQGGSTLTQQLAKNLFLSQERTIKRKVREVFFAAALESKLSKDELLGLYLGEVYLGQAGGVPLHGVEQAARAWFGVSANRLSLGQSALMAGVISSPNQYSPARHPEKAVERRDVVLARMLDLGVVTAEQVAAAKAEPVEIRGELPGTVRRAPWAVDAAVDAAEESLGEGALQQSGEHVYTTIQPLWQRAAEQAVAQGMAELDLTYPDAAGAQAALVAVRIRDGAVVAMVGSRSYADSPFNRATHAWRQAGSTVKPLTLLAALDKDPSLTPVTRLDDAPISRKVDGRTWTPTNYDGQFKGEVSLHRALEGSRNIPFVLLAENLGWGTVKDWLQDAGLSRATHLPSTALGSFATTPLEMASAFTVFPAGGTVREPMLVDRITEADGDVLVEFEPKGHDLATAKATAVATAMLEGVLTHGTGSAAKTYGVTGHAGGKTGTTDDYRDAWFVGFTPELAVAVWVGRDKGTLGLSGSKAALPTWSRFIAASGTQGGAFPTAPGVEHVAVCPHSDRVARKACPEAQDFLLVEGSVPASKDWCDDHGAPTILDLFPVRKQLPDAEVASPNDGAAALPEDTDPPKPKKKGLFKKKREN